MRAYSEEFRGEVLAACDAGEGTRAVALRFNVSESWVRRIQQQRCETGQTAPKTTRAREAPWRAWADWLRAKLQAQPDLYLRELRADLQREQGETVCLQTISNACQAIEHSRKKRR
jgi:transposase